MSGHGFARHGQCEEIKESPKFRSTWERNVYRMLLRMYPAPAYVIEYEQKRFEFPGLYYRHPDYLPDFIIKKEDGSIECIIEVKGWLDGPSKTKLRGFKKFYPELFSSMIIVTHKKACEWIAVNLRCRTWNYNDLKRQMARLVVWEK